MKELKLKRLVLDNWRGQNKAIDFGDKTIIRGANGIGKSTIMKAWFWLVSSYTSPHEGCNANLYDNRLELTPETPSASVRAVFTIGDREYTLEKRAKAKFTRKRGTSVYEKAPSDEYSLLLDDIKVTSSDYMAWVEANIAPIDMLPYLLDGSFFTTLIEEDKKKSRKVLEKIIGEITEWDLKGDYSLIKEDLERYPIDSLVMRYTNEAKPLKNTLNNLPMMIELTEKNLAEYKSINYAALLTEIEAKRKEIEDIDDKIVGCINAIKPVLEERNRIYELINSKSLEIDRQRQKYLTTMYGEVDKATLLLEEAKAKNAVIEGKNRANWEEYECALRDEEFLIKHIEQLEKKRERLLAEKEEVKNRIFNENEAICPQCGRTLPEDALEKAKERFYAINREDLDRIVLEGKTISEEIAREKEKRDGLRKIIDRGIQKEELVDYTKFEEAVEEAKKRIVPYYETEECKRLSEELKALNASIPEINEDDTENLRAYKRTISGTLEGLNRKYGLKEKMKDVERSVEELRQNQRECANKLAIIESKIDKCKAYEQERAEIVSDRVNAKLNECSLDMWDRLKDGTLVPDVVLRGKEGVKYSTLNFSDRIKVGIELQRLFCDFFSISLPTFIDEASVFDDSNLPSPDSQMVLLYADNSNYLLVETN